MNAIHTHGALPPLPGFAGRGWGRVLKAQDPTLPRPSLQSQGGEKKDVRRGFTLIELLVTMGLIILLLSIALAVSSSATFDSYKIVGAGDKLSQAMITAKSRAARDKAPRGVRLIVGADGMVRELIYIEQPEPWLPDQSQTHPITTTADRSYLSVRYPQMLSTDPTYVANTFPKPNPTLCEVNLVLSVADLNRLLVAGNFSPNTAGAFSTVYTAPSMLVASSPVMGSGFAFTTMRDVTPQNTLDEFKVPGLGTANSFRALRLTSVTVITSPDLSAGQTPTTLKSRQTYQTPQFGIYLAAKPLAGEPSMILSREAAVDLSASLYTGTAPTDVLFSPQGHVMFRSESLLGFLVRDTKKLPTPTASTNPTLYTWLSDPTVGQPNFRKAGEMTIVAVYPKAGTVFTKPVAEPALTSTTNDPFQFCRDAITNNGL